MSFSPRDSKARVFFTKNLAYGIYRFRPFPWRNYMDAVKNKQLKELLVFVLENEVALGQKLYHGVNSTTLGSILTSLSQEHSALMQLLELRRFGKASSSMRTSLRDLLRSGETQGYLSSKKLLANQFRKKSVLLFTLTDIGIKEAIVHRSSIPFALRQGAQDISLDEFRNSSRFR
jgi:hypothetical protein